MTAVSSNSGRPPDTGNVTTASKIGFFNSPACTRSACATPKSAYTLCNSRLLSSAT